MEGRHLTCNCYMSVRFAFINCIHDLVWAADESLSAALKKEKRQNMTLCSWSSSVLSILKCDTRVGLTLT